MADFLDPFCKTTSDSYFERVPEADRNLLETVPTIRDEHAVALGIAAIGAADEIFAVDEENEESLADDYHLGSDEWVDKTLKEVEAHEGSYDEWAEISARSKNGTRQRRNWRPPQFKIQVPVEPFQSHAGEKVVVGAFTLPKVEDTAGTRYRASGRRSTTAVPRRTDAKLHDDKELNIREDHEWEARGLCAQTDPDAFFPGWGESAKEAKKICNNCEVRAECLEDALKYDDLGVRGGLSEPERRRLKTGDQLPLARTVY